MFANAVDQVSHETLGYPYARVRRMGGGNYIAFGFCRTNEDCLKAIENRPEKKVQMFLLYFPHLEEGAAALAKPLKTKELS